jgi:predicted CoA-binding protein
MNIKKTLIIGASDNINRYSYKATKMLLDYDFPVALFGNKDKSVFGLPIHTKIPFDVFHTITLYIGARNQSDDIMKKIIGLKPNRVIFNPGTENSIFQNMLDQNQIPWIEACTLVLLSTNQY